MHPVIYLLTISLPLLAAIIVFAMKYAASYAAARARSADELDFKTMARDQASELAQIAASLKSIETEAARQSRSLASVESILKQVG